MEKIGYLKQIHIFRNLTEAELKELDQMTSMKTYSRREQVYGYGDPGMVIYFLLAGCVKIYKLSPEGKELTLELLEPGEILGEMALVDDSPHETIAEALEDSILCAIRCRDFEGLLQRKPDLVRHVIQLIGRRKRQIENQLENLVFRRVPARLALMLLTLATKHGVRNSQGITLDLKLSQQELANLIGTSRETVSALLNEFKRRGIIDIQQRRIKIRNQRELKAMADVTVTGATGRRDM